MIALPPPPDVAGISLDGSSPYLISPEENRSLCATMGTSPDQHGRAHPIYFYIGTQVGSSMTVSGLCSACDFDVKDGPMLGSISAQILRPIMVGQDYLVRGQIVSLSRKPSRKLGVIDLVEYRLSLLLPGNEPVVITTNTWILPRRDCA